MILDVVCMKMKWISIALVLALAGCAHTYGPVDVEKSEFQIYHDMAIRALNDPAVWQGKFSQVLPLEEKQIDGMRPVWFEIIQGEPPIITVCIPVKSPHTRFAYVGFQIDHWNGEIQKIVLGQRGTHRDGNAPRGASPPHH